SGDDLRAEVDQDREHRAVAHAPARKYGARAQYLRPQGRGSGQSPGQRVMPQGEQFPDPVTVDAARRRLPLLEIRDRVGEGLQRIRIRDALAPFRIPECRKLRELATAAFAYRFGKLAVMIGEIQERAP